MEEEDYLMAYYLFFTWIIETELAIFPWPSHPAPTQSTNNILIDIISLAKLAKLKGWLPMSQT